MLSADDHPGLFYFLVGMVVLVMAGVGLSIMVDKRFSFSKGSNEIRQDMLAGENEITQIKTELEDDLTEFQNSDSKLRANATAFNDLKTRSAGLSQRAADLTAKRSALRDAIETLDLTFSTYRISYIRKARDSAIGERLVNFTLRNGRSYPAATISKVTDVGLEIKHESGIARILAEDLPPQWSDRFLWGDDERRDREKTALRKHDEEVAAKLARAAEDEAATARLAAGIEEPVRVEEVPAEAPQVVADVPPPLPQKGTDPETVREAEHAKLVELRRRVVGWETKISTLSSSLSEARSHASYGNQSSVPGRLETWKAREQRLSAELTKARTELSIAKSKLAAVAPDDPLLRPK